LSIIVILLIKELIITVFKISYYDKKNKVLLKNKEYNISGVNIKKVMVIDSLIDLFTLLASPLILIKKIIEKILNLVF
jgi:hypothetical protein